MTQYEKIFRALKVKENDLKLYQRILKKGGVTREQKVLDHFMANYVYMLNSSFIRVIRSVMSDMLTGTATKREVSQNVVKFRLSSKYYKKYMAENYKKVADMVSGSFFDRYNIANRDLRYSIRKEVYEQFNDFIKISMQQTESDILKHIRVLQREIIQKNLKISKLKGIPNIEEIIDLETKNFKKNMLKKYPELAKQFDEGKVLKSRGWTDKDGNFKTRSYTLDTYSDFSIRATMMNMDTTLGIEDATQHGDRVVEFYLKDNRTLKTKPFPYCQKLLRKKVAGKTILALDDTAARILNIPTVATAKANYSLAPLRGCRHSVRRITDKTYINRINKILYVGELSGKE